MKRKEKGKWAMLQIDSIYWATLLTYFWSMKSSTTLFSEQFTFSKKLKEMDWIISLFSGINLKVVSSSLLLTLQLCSNFFSFRKKFTFWACAHYGSTFPTASSQSSASICYWRLVPIYNKQLFQTRTLEIQSFLTAFPIQSPYSPFQGENCSANYYTSGKNACISRNALGRKFQLSAYGHSRILWATDQAKVWVFPSSSSPSFLPTHLPPALETHSRCKLPAILSSTRISSSFFFPVSISPTVQF